MMANFTMTINDTLNNPLTPLFNFDYPFYVDDENAKNSFEEKFILYYLNCEIGYETFARFQKALQARLMIKMPYYRQLYETELASKDIDFMLNKDLKESTTRELTGTESGTGNRVLTNEESQTLSSTSTNSGEFTATSTNSGELSTTNQSTGNNKLSQLADGVASVSLEDGYLTGVSHDETTNTGSQQNDSTSTDNQQSNSTTKNEQQSSGNGTQSQEETNTRENTQKETITLISQGNIGVTSSAELLEKWRDVLINIDEIIIKDCRDLFMRIY